jgi:hypothetical protein
MSKLKTAAFFFSVLLLLSVGVYFWHKQSTDPTPHKYVQLLSDEARLWGKAAGPVQARIEFKEQSGNRVTVKGQIRSTLPQFEVEWKLPPGVRLVDGMASESIQQQADTQVVHNREITVEVDWPLENPHLVLRAAESSDGNAFGASTVFNLDPSLESLEKEEIIRAHMQSRQLQKLVK